MPDIAAISVITTGIVGVVAAVTPTLTRYFDRRHERLSRLEENEYARREHYWTLRESLYLDILNSCGRLIGSLDDSRSGTTDHDTSILEQERMDPLFPRSIAFASDQVRESLATFVTAAKVGSGLIEPHDDNKAFFKQLGNKWFDFLHFTYELLIDQIRTELASGQISLKGIGEPVTFSSVRDRYSHEKTEPA